MYVICCIDMGYFFFLKKKLWIYRQRFNMYITALKHIDETGQGVVLDRSMFGDGIFAKTNADCGNISPHGFSWHTHIHTTHRHFFFIL